MHQWKTHTHRNSNKEFTKSNMSNKKWRLPWQIKKNNKYKQNTCRPLYHRRYKEECEALFPFFVFVVFCLCCFADWTCESFTINCTSIRFNNLESDLNWIDCWKKMPSFLTTTGKISRSRTLQSWFWKFRNVGDDVIFLDWGPLFEKLNYKMD